MGIAVLGPLEVDGHMNGLSPRDRVVLSALVVRSGAPTTAETLADALWHDAAPATWTKVVQGCIVRLRKRLGPAAIESGPFGYRLTLNDEELDHRRFQRLLQIGREALDGGDPDRAAYVVQEALELWRGRALADLDEWEPGRVEAQRLEGLRMDAEELSVEAETSAGRAATVVDRARALVAEAPFRERRWALLAKALYQAGRQREALGAIKRARSMLVDELGLDPGRELVELEQLLLRQDRSLTPPVRAVSAACPYRGLLPYQAEDADSFFGRDDEVATCLRRLRDTGRLAVVGPSGVGKSSLVRAGVAASLVRAGTPVVMTTPGAHPLDSLSSLRPGGRQTLVVDQAEEAVTVCVDAEERERYFAALGAHVGAGGALVLSLRADHLGDLAPYPSFARVVEDCLYLLGPMNDADLRSAIEGPARRAGLRLEPGLVDLLVREVEGGPASLPLLSHVLRETWERREGPTLTLEGYRASGGIRRAVAQSAETLYDGLDPAERGRLRSLMLRLVTPSADAEATRTRAPRSKVVVDDAHARLVEQLVEARLVSVDGDTVQIAHEALVRVWPRLRGWLDDDVEGQLLFRHLAGAADAWAAMGRPESELYRGARLSRTLEWRKRARPRLDDSEAAFLDASVAVSAAEQRTAEQRVARERRVNRRLRSALAGVGVLLVLTLVAGLAALRSADDAGRERDRAQSSANLADAGRASAQSPLHEDVDTGLLLAVAALQVDSSPQAWENLGTALTRAGPLAAVRDVSNLVGRPRSAAIGSVAAGGAGDLVAAGLDLEGVRLFDASTLSPVDFSDQTPSNGIALSPDGGQLAMAVNPWEATGPAGPGWRPIRLYDLPGGEPSKRQLGGFSYRDLVEYSLSFSNRSPRFAAVVEQRTEGDPAHATVWDLGDPSEPIFRLAVPSGAAAGLSPDGRSLFVAADGPSPLRVYHVADQRLARSAADRYLSVNGVSDLVVSPDGSTVAVASGDRILRFNAATLKARGHPLRGHRAYVVDLAYSHDGRLLVSTSGDRSAIVWDARTAVPVHRFLGHRSSVGAATFSADDRTLYTAGGDGLLLAWNLGRGARLLTLGEATEARGAASLVAVPGPDGHTVARLTSGMLAIEDTRTGRTTVRPAPGAEHVTWSPDGRRVLTTGDNGLLRMWSAGTAELLASRQLRGGPVLAAFDPSGHEVYVADSEATLTTLRSPSLVPAYPDADLGLGEEITAVIPHPRNGSVIAVKGDGSLQWVQPDEGRLLRVDPLVLSDEEFGGTFAPDGSMLAAPDRHQDLRLLDVETMQWRDPDTQTPFRAVSYAPDGSQFASVQSERIRLWNGHTGAYQASVPLPSLTAEVTIAYLPDSSGLLVASTDGRTWTVNTRTSTWPDRACAIAARNLTQAEWRQFFPRRPYQVTCPRWPPGA